MVCMSELTLKDWMDLPLEERASRLDFSISILVALGKKQTDQIEEYLRESNLTDALRQFFIKNLIVGFWQSAIFLQKLKPTHDCSDVFDFSFYPARTLFEFVIKYEFFSKSKPEDQTRAARLEVLRTAKDLFDATDDSQIKIQAKKDYDDFNEGEFSPIESVKNSELKSFLDMASLINKSGVLEKDRDEYNPYDLYKKLSETIHSPLRLGMELGNQNSLKSWNNSAQLAVRACIECVKITDFQFEHKDAALIAEELTRIKTICYGAQS